MDGHNARMLQISGDARFTNEAFLAFFISKPHKDLESDAAAEWLIDGFQYLAHSAMTDFPSPFVSALVDLLREIGHYARHRAGRRAWYCGRFALGKIGHVGTAQARSFPRLAAGPLTNQINISCKISHCFGK
jgi:hypothetical protein